MPTQQHSVRKHGHKGHRIDTTNGALCSLQSQSQDIPQPHVKAVKGVREGIPHAALLTKYQQARHTQQILIGKSDFGRLEVAKLDVVVLSTRHSLVRRQQWLNLGRVMRECTSNHPAQMQKATCSIYRADQVGANAWKMSYLLVSRML